MNSTAFVCVLFIVLLLITQVCAYYYLRDDGTTEEERRTLQESFYHVLTIDELGEPNPDIAIGNPMKGLMESPLYTFPPYEADIPLALEFYYIGLDEVIVGPDLFGLNIGEKAYNWTLLDGYLEGSASRTMHAVWRFYLHFPGIEKSLSVPKHLHDAGVVLQTTSSGSSTLDYNNPVLLKAIEAFITHLGTRYDGDTRIAFIQAGFIGLWGEWHTYNENEFLYDSTKEKLINYFSSSFTKTKIQIRYPMTSAYEAGFGYHDDSFAFQTLDGEANGGQIREWYFWPSIVKQGQSDVWHRGVIGGETRISIQEIVFKPDYQAGTFEKQPYELCIETTHATYSFFHLAFKDGGFKGEELAKARRVHARFGYNYYVSKIATKKSNTTTTNTVDIEVSLAQIGVAPFYYPLNLTIGCPAMTRKTLPGVETLIDLGEKMFLFTGIPAVSSCLDSLTLGFESNYLYSGRPIKLAQGNGDITFAVPIPDGQKPENKSFAQVVWSMLFDQKNDNVNGTYVHENSESFFVDFLWSFLKSLFDSD